MQRFVKIILIVCCFLIIKNGKAQGIHGASISYKWLSGYTYSLTGTLALDSSTASTHTNVAWYFGDGDSCTTSFSNSSVGKIIIYKFNCTHTYSGPGLYKPYFIDNYRISAINNITNSGSKSIWIEALLSINAFMGPNSSPLYPNPLFSISKGNTFIYNPGLYDVDGDSLSYHLINCSVTPPNSYYIPVNTTLNSSTGNFTYQADTAGIYAFKFLVKEWRKDLDGAYQFIGNTEMDFTLNVDETVGINELNANKISIYPNPVSTILNLQLNSKPNSYIEITNTLGATILQQPYSETIDVSKLNPGVYFIRLDNSFSKFIKE